MSTNTRWQMAEWHAIARETSLAVGLICEGANGLGRATYADLSGYHVGFFGLANGLERLGKLVYVFDHRMRTGEIPSDRDLRKLGHSLENIVRAVRQVAADRELDLMHGHYPEDHIVSAVESHLASFADASRGRYANFLLMSGTDSRHEPVASWWANVVEPILARHWNGTPSETKAAEGAAVAEAVFGEVSLVMHFDETGVFMDSCRTASMRTAQNEVAQRYGRYYSLKLVRWMADVFYELSRDASGSKGDPLLSGHYERMYTLCVEDDLLLKRKRWPLS